MTARRSVLYGLTGWPVAAISAVKANAAEANTPTIKPKLFYLWVFSHAQEDWVPIGVFNTREEGELVLKDTKAQNGVVLESTWDEFVSMATSSRIGELAKALEKIGLKI
jgi:hypothetical protein